MGVVSGGACAERRMCRYLVAPSCENQFFSDSRAFLTLVWYSLCIVFLPYLFCIYLCIIIVRVLLALIACSSYLVIIIYWSSVTDRVLGIVRAIAFVGVDSLAAIVCVLHARGRLGGNRGRLMEVAVGTELPE